MTPKRVYFLMLGLVILLSAAFVGSVVGGNIFLQNHAKKLNDLKVQDKVLEQQQTALIQAKKDITKYAELEKDSKSVVPQDKDQAKTVVDIFQLANESGITIRSITFPSSNLGTKAAPTTNSSNDSGGGSSATNNATSPISQAKPIDGIKGVYSLEVNIVPDENRPVTYYQLLDFLSKLENNRRTAQVTQIKITPATSSKQNPILTFTLTINIFIKPS